jgi:hypothetical protein
MDNQKIVNVMISIPNMGYTAVEAYGNRLTNFLKMGIMQRDRLLRSKARGLLSEEQFETFFGDKEVLQPFNFYFVQVGRMFTPAAREEAAKKALEYDCDFLFMVDDDMICPDDLFLKLYRHKDVADVVAPLAFTRNAPYKPVCYASVEGWDAVNKEPYFINNTVMNYQRNKLMEVDAVGFGAALINVNILRKIQQPWFMSSEGTGEDILFCYKVKHAGGKVFMDTSVKIGHIGHPQIITEEFVDEYRKKIDPIHDKRYPEFKKYEALTILGD